MIDEILENELPKPTKKPRPGQLTVIEKGVRYLYNHDGELVEASELVGPGGTGRVDPRQAKAWDYYIYSLTRGVPNAKQAALKAGYSESFARVVTLTKWWKEKKRGLKKRNMLTRAENNLSQLLKMDYSSIKLLEDGTQVEDVDIDKAKLVKDVSVFIAQTLGKDEGYSYKTEQDKRVSHDIKIEAINYADVKEIPEPAKDLIQEAVYEEIEEEKEYNNEQ